MILAMKPKKSLYLAVDRDVRALPPPQNPPHWHRRRHYQLRNNLLTGALRKQSLLQRCRLSNHRTPLPHK
jgi:hypothetical protein